MITPQNILVTVEQSHRAILKLIEKGESVERYTREYHNTAIVGYKISVFTIEKHKLNDYKISFNGVNLWKLLITFDADHNQMEEFKEMCISIFLLLEKTWEEINDDQYKFYQLNRKIKNIINS